MHLDTLSGVVWSIVDETGKRKGRARKDFTGPAASRIAPRVVLTQLFRLRLFFRSGPHRQEIAIYYYFGPFGDLWYFEKFRAEAENTKTEIPGARARFGRNLRQP